MMTFVSLSANLYNELTDHLASTDVEQVAFMFTTPSAKTSELHISEIYPVPRGDFDYQSDRHVTLTDQVRGDIIKRAHDTGGSLVEAHSHVAGPAQFSPSDLFGFDDWVPHVRWRLRGRPYVALVFAGRAFDALVWQGQSSRPQPLDYLNIEDRQRLLPSGLTYKRISKSRT
jgi:hypothetical protein